MGPAGGGRQLVTPRFLRHFNTIGYVEMSDESKTMIFETILANWLGRFPGSGPQTFGKLAEPIVKATIKTFNKVVAELLPTPARCHYIFNLRDLSKVFQGTLMGEPKILEKPVQLVRLWAHECVRVFEDRMINEDDHAWFRKLMADNCLEFFRMPWEDASNNADKVVNPHHILLYGDFMIPGADPKIYCEIPEMEELKHRVEEYLR
jgi:dynein heavy chain